MRRQRTEAVDERPAWGRDGWARFDVVHDDGPRRHRVKESA